MGTQQCVVLNNIQSSWTTVISSVTQSSVLGPLLFTIFVNDIPCIVGSDAFLFANDINLSQTIMNSDDIITSTEKKKDLGIWNDSSLDLVKLIKQFL